MPHSPHPGPGYKALRRGRISLPGQSYFVTTVCHQRRRHFEKWDTASAFCRKFHSAELWKDSMLLCWVLMPDHLHFMVDLGEEESLSALLRRVKAITSRTVRKVGCDINGPVWMSGFHERLMRDGLNREAAARYIIANPIRAGLVKSCRDYPYWDAVWLDLRRVMPGET